MGRQRQADQVDDGLGTLTLWLVPCWQMIEQHYLGASGHKRLRALYATAIREEMGRLSIPPARGPRHLVVTRFSDEELPESSVQVACRSVVAAAVLEHVIVGLGSRECTIEYRQGRAESILKQHRRMPPSRMRPVNARIEIWVDDLPF